MNDTDTEEKNTPASGFSKIGHLFGTTGGGVENSTSDQKPKSLEHAPAIPSSEDIARMTAPDETKPSRFNSATVSPNDTTMVQEEGEGGFLSEDVVFRGKQPSPVRDPLFAARVLEQEERAAEQFLSSPEGKDPLAPFTLTKKESGDEVQKIRTYQSDVAGALKKEKTSLIQMVLAEHEKRRDVAEEMSPTQPKNIALIILSVFLVCVGIAVAGFATWQYAENQKERATQSGNLPSVPSFISVEEQQGVDITDLTKDRIARAIAGEIISTDIRLDSIKQIYLVRDATETGSSPPARGAVQTLVRTSDFWLSLESGMPEALARALSQDFFIGVHSFNGNQPFIILRADYFESAFAGMLRWENTLARDVLPLFGIQATPALITKQFVDVVIQNRDYRAILDEAGDVVLLYFFHDKNTIIIATADETMKEVVDRLNRSSENAQ